MASILERQHNQFSFLLPCRTTKEKKADGDARFLTLRGWIEPSLIPAHLASLWACVGLKSRYNPKGLGLKSRR